MIQRAPYNFNSHRYVQDPELFRLSVSNLTRKNLWRPNFFYTSPTLDNTCGPLAGYNLSQRRLAQTFNGNHSIPGYWDNGQQVFMPHAILDERAWNTIDTDAIMARFEDAPLMNALIQLNLINNLDLTTWVRTIQILGKAVNIKESMAAETPSDEDDEEVKFVQFPIPVQRGLASWPARELQTNIAAGIPVDTRKLTQISQGISEFLENHIVFGSDVRVGQARIYGLNNFPQAQVVSDPTNFGGVWTDPLNVDQVIYKGLELMDDNNYKPPFMLFMSSDLYYLTTKRITDTERKAWDHLREIEEISVIRKSKKIPQGTLFLVEASKRTIQWNMALPYSVWRYESLDGTRVYTSVMEGGSLSLIPDADDKSGVLKVENLNPPPAP